MHVRVPAYSGSNPRRRERQREQIRAAQKLEEHINARVPADGCEVFIYGMLAFELHLDPGMVRDLLNGSGGGYNGITVWGKDYKPPVG